MALGHRRIRGPSAFLVVNKLLEENFWKGYGLGHRVGSLFERRVEIRLCAGFLEPPRFLRIWGHSFSLHLLKVRTGLR